MRAGTRAARTPVLVSMAEAARSLGISRTYAYFLARSGTLKTVRLGRRVLVPVWALERIAGTPGREA